MPISLRIELNSNLFIRDPQDTKLGQKIISESIKMVDELGFERFTFKKLAGKIASTEASIYRYFENKHALLTYLISWYWEWLSFQIDIGTSNIKDPKKKLKIAIKRIVETLQDSPSIDYIDLNSLHQIVIAEGAKAYHTKDVDLENKKGFFLSYKQLVKKIAGFIRNYNPEFKYPFALATNVLEMANNHIYFAQHLPGLTDIHVEKDNFDEVIKMLEYFVFKLNSEV